MKKSFLALFMILICTQAFASEWNEIMYYRGRSLGRTPLEQIKKSQEILTKTKNLLDRGGVRTAKVSYKDGAGNAYQALRILPGAESALNEEARRIESELYGLPLVFSPYDLSRSKANAFFDANGSKIGVSYHFIEGNGDDSSYLHEVQHAMTYRSVLNGRNFLWAGILKAPFGKYISKKNTSYYESFASLDEVIATSLSVMLDSQKLLELRREQSPKEFLQSRGEADSLLNELYYSIRAGKFLAHQVADTAERALSILPQSKMLAVELKLGKEKREIFVTSIKLDSYGREFRNGKGTVVAYPGETEWKLFWPTNYSERELRNRLVKLNRASNELAEKFQTLESCVAILIEYPQIHKTDFQCIEKYARIPFLTFQDY